MAVVPAESIEAHRQALVFDVEQGLLRAQAALGLASVDAEHTCARAVLPVIERFVPSELPPEPIFDLHSGFASGAPAIDSDGMVSQALGALRFSEAVAARAATEPLTRAAYAALHATQPALRQIRTSNRFTVWGAFQTSQTTRQALTPLVNLLWPSFVKNWAYLGLKKPAPMVVRRL
jgi:hypothetical protein